MSDQALVWKAGFGALVLLFSAATYLTRKHPDVPPPVTPAAIAAPALQASAPGPADVEDDTPPVRIQVSLHDAQPLPLPALRPRVKQRIRPAKTAAPRVHTVVARRKASPYAIGRKHYPYDPKERWAALREAP